MALLGLALLLTCSTSYPAVYYVNDLNTNGDVYVTTTGHDANTGTSIDSPMLTLTNLLATYLLQPGDIVYVDTGIYSNYTVTINRSGTAANPILIQGSTNLASGSIFDKITGVGSVFSLSAVTYVHLRNLTVRHGQTGVSFANSSYCDLFRIIAISNQTGFASSGSQFNQFLRCITAYNYDGWRDFAGGCNWEYGVSWYNTNAFLPFYPASLTNISHSVIVGGVFVGNANFPLSGDYNVFWNTILGGYANLAELQAAQNGWMNCTVANPQFLNAPSLDFTLLSGNGYFLNGLWVTNGTVFSPCIDFGYPQNLLYTNEPVPNGSRINVGSDGGTWRASKSSTNAYVFTLSYNDGGTLTDTGMLRWTCGGFSNSATVRLQYSTNNGIAWTSIATSIPVTNSSFTWVATGFPSSLFARWRVESEGTPYAVDTNDATFVVRAARQGFTFYVNDFNTNGDVYCTAKGSNNYNGLTPSTPKPDLQEIFDTYEVGSGDAIYVDTGIYTNMVSIPVRKAGSSLAYLAIVGSTNFAYGGSIIERSNAGFDAVRLLGASYVHFKNFTLRWGRYGIYGFAAAGASPGYNIFENIGVYSNQVGVNFDSCPSNRFVNCALSRNTIGFQIAGSATQSRGNTWENGAVVFNTTGFNLPGAGTLSISNSIISGGTVFAAEVPSGDFNVIWNATLKTGYATLSSLQKSFNSWWHSLYADPGFADANGMDFHLRSPTGRWNPATGTFVTTDTNYSRAIDFGHPVSMLYTNEPHPNGERLNAGMYGGTQQASKSRTNVWVETLTFNDGGVLDASADVLYWTAGNYLPGQKVSILLSRDSGVSWLTIATNLAIENGSYAWTNSSYASSSYSKWRIVVDADTNVWSQTQTDFLYRNGPFVYYINDASTNGDVYCKEPGNDSNLGVSPETPKRLLSSLLNSVNLLPNDTVYMDTGLYPELFGVKITALDCGTNGAPVTIQGSTNYIYGGSVINRLNTGPTAYGIEFSPINGNPTDVIIRDLAITNAGHGVYANQGQRLVFDGIQVRNGTFAGFYLTGCSNAALQHCVGHRCGWGLDAQNSSAVQVEHSIFWRNTNTGIRAVGGVVTISNSVVAAEGVSAQAYVAQTPLHIQGNYNCIFVESNAVAGIINSLGLNLNTLADWTRFTTQEICSLQIDPEFADPISRDYHLKTTVALGRHLPNGDLTSDAVDSPLLDAGAPTSPYVREPQPNGNRVNIGLYGNTAQATIGPTNSRLQVASLVRGGGVSGLARLHWVVGGEATGHVVKVECSLDGGGNWSLLSNNVLSSSELCYWETTLINNTPAGLWRVSSLSDSNLISQTTNFFAVRHSPLDIYVNDARTNLDVFVCAPGNETNWVASTNQPLLSLVQAINAYSIGPGDRIWVDTGYYTNTANLQLGRLQSGLSNAPVSVLGNSIYPYSGTVFDRASTAPNARGMDVTYAKNLVFSNLVFMGGHTGVRLDHSSNVMFTIRAALNATNGVEAFQSQAIDISRTVIEGNGGVGLLVSATSIVTVTHSLIQSNGLSALAAAERATLTVSNSILLASGLGRFVYRIDDASSTLYANFNDVVARDGSSVARNLGTALKYLYDWQRAVSNDTFSLSHDPQFADEAIQDYHLRSQTGRYLPGGGTTTDTVASVLIDAGDPSVNYALEPNPNGARINIGLHGNTTQASRSLTNGWLLALTLNDGGSIRDTNTLHWAVGGSATNHLVDVQLSYDGGDSWTTLISNVQATNQVLTWNTTNYPSGGQVLWRVISQSDSNMVSQTLSYFAIKNEPIGFYVNDAFTNGDVYCTAPGAIGNSGLRPSEPKSSLHDLLNAYKVEPGDTVYVDTGSYLLTNTVSLSMPNNGSTNMITIQGSTNAAMTGSVFLASCPLAFAVENTVNIGLRHLVVRGAHTAFRFNNTTNCYAELVQTYGARAAGFEVEDSFATRFTRCAAVDFSTNGLLTRNSDSVLWASGVLFPAGLNSNDIAYSEGRGFLLDGGSIHISNSVFVATSRWDAALECTPSAQIVSEYNDFYLTNGAAMGIVTLPENVAGLHRIIYDTLSDWSLSSGQDLWSLSHEPELAAPRLGDFHPRSTAGRYDPDVGIYVYDDEICSQLLDVGNKNAPYALEPTPNGARINMGLWGNTTEASLSPTNSSFVVLTLNDGGVARGTNFMLRWAVRGHATAHTVRIRFSPDGGSTWQQLASGLNASQEFYAWNTTAMTSTAQGVWSVESEVEPSVFARNAHSFGLRNTPLHFYVNDASTTGDVYCAEVGSSSNSGLSASSPKATLLQVLDAYDLEPMDVIYLDTGIYSNPVSIAVRQSDTGDGTNPVYIIGSTNSVAGGSLFRGGGGIVLQNSRGMDIRYLGFEDVVPAGIVVRSSERTFLQNLQVQRGNNGYSVSASRNTRFTGCLARGAVSNGLYHASSVDTVWESGVLWSNGVNAVAIARDSTIQTNSLRIANSVLGAFGSGRYLYCVDYTFDADYNLLSTQNGSLIASEAASPLRSLYDSVSRWTRDTRRDSHSLIGPHGFALAISNDFHLVSRAGRYNPSTGLIVTDAVTSLLIDAGDPSAIYTNEPNPNGARINIGLYGNSWEESRSPTNSNFSLISLNDGGRVEGTNAHLCWVAQGNATGQLVRLLLSTDGGASWDVLASNIFAYSGLYVWNTLPYDDTMQGVWAIESQDELGVLATSAVPFAIRNGPQYFYVNDAFTNGDIYTAEIGLPTNTGLSSTEPKSTIQGILDAYDLESGDIVYVDTGTYGGTTPIIIGQLDGANSTNAPCVVFQGSTNEAAGGTMIERAGGNYGFRIYQAMGIELRNFNINNAQVGVSLERAYNAKLEWLKVSGGDLSYSFQHSDGIQMAHCAQTQSGRGLEASEQCHGLFVDHCIFWSNTSHAISLNDSSLFLSNSVLGVWGRHGVSNFAYNISYGSLNADYNCIFLQNNAMASYRAVSPSISSRPLIYPSISLWRRGETQDVHSLTCDPLFFNPNRDFHLLSEGGRYDVTAGVFVVDSMSSPLIDAGMSMSAYSNETLLNGARVNIGLYGNSWQASRSTTNSSLTAITLNDGGRVEGLASVYWIARGNATGHTMRIDYSPDAGSTWFTVVAGVPVGAQSTIWNTPFFQSSIRGVWRISSEMEPSAKDSTDGLFAVRNNPLLFYVNDNAISGDVYTSVVGSSANHGATADKPKRRLSEIIDAWDLEPGDTVFMDTGTYLTTETITMTYFDSGIESSDPLQQVHIVGSTNEAAGGSVFVMATRQDGIVLDDAPGVELRHLLFRGANRAVRINRAGYHSCHWLKAQNGTYGYDINNASNVVFRNCLAANNLNDGIVIDGQGSSINWDSGILWSNRYAVWKEDGAFAIHNSIMGVFGAQRAAYYIVEVPYGGASLTSDYNNIYVQQGGMAGAIQMGSQVGAYTSHYVSVAKWLTATTQDKYSLAYEPGFADLGSGDYHLRSTKGRYKTGFGWTNDSTSSLLIDSGAPFDPAVTNEPAPNGGRINVGLYGGTWQASMTPTQGWYSIITLNDGGAAQGTIELRWFAGWNATGHTVRLDFSPDNGLTWTNIITGYPASTLSYWWDSEPYGRTALGRWRITSEVDPSINATSAYRSVWRNGGMIPFYVNDASTNGDVYCLAPGNPTNDGLTVFTPKDSIQAILNEWDLDPADTIYMDSGTYVLSQPVIIDGQSSGWDTNFVYIQGGTNVLVPTIIKPSSGGGSPFVFSYARNFRLSHVIVQDSSDGISLYNSENCEFYNVKSQNNTRQGFTLLRAKDILFDHCAAWNNRSGLTNGIGITATDSGFSWLNGIMWRNYHAITYMGAQSSPLIITNSILQASGPFARIMIFDALLNPLNVIKANYNNYTLSDGALFCEKMKSYGGSDFYLNLHEWQGLTSQDSRSLAHDPLFADEFSGDFHLQSTMGRYVPEIGWTNDASDSPMIDVGDPGFAYDLENDPNGARINVGLYGNSTEASLSRTNPWLLAVSFNDGGVLSGTNMLYWLSRNMTNGSTVNVEYTMDGAVSWSSIQSNVLASQSTLDWDVSQMTLSPLVKWRVSSESDTNVYDVSDQFSVIRNGVYTYYVNDTSMVGDVYCYSIGAEANSGTNAASPLDCPARLFNKYPIMAGDTVFIDTGIYRLTDGRVFTLGPQNRGTEFNPIRIFGSTNFLTDGSVIIQTGTNENVLVMSQTRHVNIEGLKLTGGQNGLIVNDCYSGTLRSMAVYGNKLDGLRFSGGDSFYLDRCLAWGNQNYGMNIQARSPPFDINHSVLWGNKAAALAVLGGSLNVSNSILHSSANSRIVVMNEMGATYDGDYNVFWYEPGGTIATDVSLHVGFENFKQWQSQRSSDEHSFLADPLFVEPTNGNFYLRSEEGCFSSGDFLKTTNTSWAIDAGDFTSTYSFEPSPNGGRLNAGLHGNTPRASKSLTNNPSLYVASLRDGGVMQGEQLLYWLYRGLPPTNTVQIEVSLDGMKTWQVITSGISIASQGFYWVGTNEPSPVAYWKVSLESNTNIMDRTLTNFMFRPAFITYYVNDASTTGDVYTFAPGNPTNSGFWNYEPKSSIRDIVNSYQLLPGDKVCVDTGVYTVNQTIAFGYFDKGVATSRVQVIGSTNWAYGGSQLIGNPNRSAFSMSEAEGIGLKNLSLSGFSNGVVFESRSSFGVLENMRLSDLSAEGVSIKGSYAIAIANSVITRCLGSGISVPNGAVKLENCVIWSNNLHALSLYSGSAFITGSVLHANGGSNACYNLTSNALLSVHADYNCIYFSGGARPVLVDGIPIEGMLQWVRFTTQDLHSISIDPLFHDPANDDFHVRSERGRFDPILRTNVQGDIGFSALIDMGPPNWPYNIEPEPNGGRRNVGLYGNTAEASMSPTNPWLRAVTASAGGLAERTFPLVWTWGNLDPTNIVFLDYSYDNGLTWISIDNAPITDPEYWWISDTKIGTEERWPTSPFARWRIKLEADTNLYDICPIHFGLRNHPFTYYMNDDSTNGDLYTTALGNDTNLGFFVYAPKLTLTNLLETFDLEGEDFVLIDTGTYVIQSNAPVIWTSSDQGSQGKPVLVKGNTNALQSVLAAAGAYPPPGNMIRLNASYINFEALQVLGGSISSEGEGNGFRSMVISNASLRINGGYFVVDDLFMNHGETTAIGAGGAIHRVEIRTGRLAVSGTNVVVDNTLVYATNATALSVSGHNVSVSNNTIVSKQSAIVKTGEGLVRLANNIVVANGRTNYVVKWSGGSLESDHNNLVARNGAWIGNKDGSWEKMLYWQRASGLDLNSLSVEPQFVNESGADLHLKSAVGHWTPTGWVGDAVSSPLIDVGNPLSPYDYEPEPNGGVINLGAYGNTEQASKSPSTPWLLTVTVNDGGVLKGTNITRWIARNYTPGRPVRFEYSINDGGSWITVATNLDGSMGYFVWDTTLVPSSLTAKWRLIDEWDSGISDTCDSTFAVRNTPLEFYVNDNSTIGDVYCSVAGNPAFDGLSSSTPKRELQDLLDAYDLEALDVVKVDTGSYSLTSDVTVIWSRSGDAEYGQMLVQGSTNYAAGGSVLNRGNTAAGMAVNVKGSYVTLRDLDVRTAHQGFSIETNQNTRLEMVVARNNRYGLRASAAVNLQVQNARFWSNELGAVSLANTRTARVENSTFVDNSGYGISIYNTANDVLQNNIFVVSSNTPVYTSTFSAVQAAFIDYNVYHLQSQAKIYGAFNDLKTWQLASAKDYRSNITNPLLANAAAGDFHLMSQYGRYVDGVGWTMDAETSWAIDRGNPSSDYSLEPMTNGSRINIGAYGNTPFASKGATNSILEVRSLNSSTSIGVTNSLWPLTWTAFRLPSNETLTVQYSGDGGVNWVTLTNGVSAYQEYILWQTIPYYNTAKGRWRVVGESNTNYWDVNNGVFNIFYGEFKISQIYRDANLNNIVWRGAWDEHYLVEYSTDMTNWLPATSGGGLNQSNDFISVHGGDFTYADLDSVAPPWRMYRVRHIISPDVIVDIAYISKVNNMATMVWSCTEPSTYTVEYSTNMNAWVLAPTGGSLIQRATFTEPTGGDFTYQDVGSSNAPSRLYRVKRQ